MSHIGHPVHSQHFCLRSFGVVKVGYRLIAATLVIGLATFAAVLPGQMAGAANDVVTNCNGSGPGSLDAVVAAASSGDIITFSVTCPPSSPIALASTIRIDGNLAIDGPEASDLVVSGNDSVGVFDVGSAGTLSVSGITIEDGLADAGGGIYNGGTLTITASTLSENSASDAGGGIYNSGTLTISASTLSGNSVPGVSGAAGGIYNSRTLSVTDSTLSKNDAGHGGGIFNEEGTVTVSDSTFSGDSANNGGGGGDIVSSGSGGKVTAAATIFSNSPSGGDCAGTGVVGDAGYNLADDYSCKFNSVTSKSGVKPHLGPLKNNGGPTRTQSPAIGSPVLDRIPPGATGNGITLCSGTDQRGVPRPKKADCDIGAVEMERGLGTVGKHFSFTFTTFGRPVPKITEKGTLPNHLTFTNNGNGTATISGKPKTSGTYHLTIKATFGSGASKLVVKQAFTLTVVA